MKHLTTKEPRCVLYSLAMVMDSTPDTILRTLGVDDLDLWFPELGGNLKYRGLLLSDCQDFAHQAGKCFYVVEVRPQLEGRDLYARPAERFIRMIAKRQGILIVKVDEAWHACAWDGEKVLDPRYEYPTKLAGYDIKEAWMLGRSTGRV